jgi:hypothetical protein
VRTSLALFVNPFSEASNCPVLQSNGLQVYLY